MHEIAFSIGSIQIHWYGIFASLGFLGASMLLLKNREYAGITKDNVLDIAMIAMFAGILGARLFYVIQFHKQFENNLAEIIRIDKGGLVFYGGFICSLIALIVFCRVKKIRFIRLLDIFAPAILFGHALGRIGCFLQGCCFGKPCGDFFLGVTYPPASGPSLRYPAELPLGEISRIMPSVPLYPVQLFEAGANLIFCCVLMILLKKKFAAKPGRICGIYFIGYGVIRILTELLRGDHRDFLFGVLTPAQTTGLFLMIPVGFIFLFLPSGKELPCQNGKQ